MNSFPDIVSENELENINQTSCEIDRGGCYQPLDLQIDGRPLCHRKIPTVHGLKVRDYYIVLIGWVNVFTNLSTKRLLPMNSVEWLL